MPAIGMRTPPGALIPRNFGWYACAASTRSAGSVPSRKIFCSPYMSSRKRFSAAMRCTRPRSTWAHSAAPITRGTRQIGKIFSVPCWSEYTENVTPWL
jgi:hypothetical protein